MNKRERILAIAVGAMLGLLVLSLGGRRVGSMFTGRSDRIFALEQEIAQKEKLLIKNRQARRALTVYEERSLPQDPVLANSRYRDWLHRCCEAAGIERRNVNWVTGRRVGNAYDIHQFSVNCTGDLPQLVNLLYEFYSVDHLHRMKFLSVQPQADGQFTLNLEVEAVSVPTADPDKQLTDEPSQRLAFAELDPYLNAMLNRNYFSEANEPPTLVSLRAPEAYVNRRLSFELQGEDPEGMGVRFEMDEDSLPEALEGLRLDGRTGRVTWTPPEVGSYTVPIRVIDRGLPARSSISQLTINVVEPPPPAAPEPRAPAFDAARFTKLTGVTEVNGARQAWISNNPEGTLLKLGEGQEIRVGAFSGVIMRIHARSIEIESEGTRFTVHVGESISNGRILN